MCLDINTHNTQSQCITHVYDKLYLVQKTSQEQNFKTGQYICLIFPFFVVTISHLLFYYVMSCDLSPLMVSHTHTRRWKYAKDLRALKVITSKALICSRYDSKMVSLQQIAPIAVPLNTCIFSSARKWRPFTSYSIYSPLYPCCRTSLHACACSLQRWNFSK